MFYWLKQNMFIVFTTRRMVYWLAHSFVYLQHVSCTRVPDGCLCIMFTSLLTTCACLSPLLTRHDHIFVDNMVLLVSAVTLVCCTDVY